MAVKSSDLIAAACLVAGCVLAELPPENAFTSFSNHTFTPGGAGAALKLVDALADAGYNVITHTLRSKPDLNSPEVRELAKRYFARAHDRGLKVYMDTDPRIARHAFIEKHPADKQRVLRFGVAPSASGAAAVEIVQAPLDDHMSWGSKRPYEAVSARFVKAWAVKTLKDGSVAAREVTAEAAILKPDRVSVSASGIEAGESLAALAEFALWSIDIFSPHLLPYVRGIMADYKDLGADGGMRDEWGFPPTSSPGFSQHRTFWYSPNYAEAYKRATGRILIDDALLFAFPLDGRARERSAAVTAYMRLNWERNTEIERDFYDTDKKLFGQDVYVCKHPTWYPVIGWQEFIHDGLHWWSAKRDWAQTDEVTPVPAACGMAKKFGGATWMNEGYQPDAKLYAPMIWRYALCGGRMVFHPVYPANQEKYKKMPPLEAALAKHTDVIKESKRARECVRLLSRISSAPIDCPVAFVFGHSRVAWDWTDPAWGDWGRGQVYGIWSKGYGVDLYPSTEIGAFTVGGDGFLRMGAQRYQAVVLHNLSSDDFTAFDAVAKNWQLKTRVFRGADGVVAYLDSVPGLAKQTPMPTKITQNAWGAVLPEPDGILALTDGTRARIKAKNSPGGDPISGKIELPNGAVYEYSAIGLFAANADFVCGAGVRYVNGPGVDVTCDSPRDIVIEVSKTGKH